MSVNLKSVAPSLPLGKSDHCSGFSYPGAGSLPPKPVESCKSPVWRINWKGKCFLPI